MQEVTLLCKRGIGPGSDGVLCLTKESFFAVILKSRSD